MSTSVPPTATMPTIDDWSRTLSRFRVVRNDGLANDRKMKTMSDRDRDAVVAQPGDLLPPDGTGSAARRCSSAVTGSVRCWMSMHSPRSRGRRTRRAR